MRFLSVCSGIEAASVAFGPLGWSAVAFAEIEPFPSAVLAHRFPDVPNWGDITKFKEWPDADFDVLCGGTPCQAFSVAGLRGGLADPRGNLSLVFLGIVDRYRPRWVVWENVPGVLSSTSHVAPDPCPPPDPVDLELDGQEVVVEDHYDSDESHAFSCFLAGLSELGYGIAYRSLDAQYAGLAQRRERVFVVGYLGDWRRAAAVLFERESLSGYPPPSREAGQGTAGSLTASAGGSDENDARDGRLVTGTMPARSRSGGGFGTDFDCDGVLITGTLCAFGKAAGSATQQDAESGMLIAQCLTTGTGRRYDPESETLIAHTLRGSGFDASEDGTGRGTPLIPCEPYTLAIRGRGDSHDLEYRQDWLANALLTPNGGRAGIGVGAVAYAVHGENSNAIRGDGNAPAAFPVDVARCLDTAGGYSHNQGGNVVAFNWQASGETGAALGYDPQAGITGTLQAHQYPAVAFAENSRAELRLEGGDGQRTGALSACGGKVGQALPAVLTRTAVRRLTPLECERLQGFPDNWTRISWRGKPASECPDGVRYKALGNSWAVPVPRWIGEQIEIVDKL